ncbi:uncharacterized protein BYT42DRAFT_349099 [Radiomyces spectabilis]|uniref:uncharacterized protein n=1 Tax=Radiomyces spectabilis TaxID=64574 RepID=UPI002220A8BF|nr:uncharacterized protein BYT42DRAFT_349099 [Radiomyces spectabilis]KAI8377575.1 hypothetical protein BYT42DRAFT_349099 [Radiomyces spectabilis]
MLQYYGDECQCKEVQPRRGKNLPNGCLDSRAKKLRREDKEDHEFSISWLRKNGHPIYKNENDDIVGLAELQEVSLCKAHSSTLYRSRRKYELHRFHSPPSPTDSNTMTVVEDRSPSHESTPSDASYASPSVVYSNQPLSSGLRRGGLAAKVNEIAYRQQQQQQHAHQSPLQPELPDFSTMSASTSLKRKRTGTPVSPLRKPCSSASTPLLPTATAPFSYRQNAPIAAPRFSYTVHEAPETFSSQLPPLHTRNVSSSSAFCSLSSSLQQQLHLSKPYPQPPTLLAHKSALLDSYPMVETVSLKMAPSLSEENPTYCIRNLAITDHFTFRDLLAEIEMIGSPPPGKRIVVFDDKNETIFPFDQAIRSVIQRPESSHLELCLGLTDKASIDWKTLCE